MEIWLDVIGYEGSYQVSNFGNIKSLSRKVKCNSSYRIINEIILRPKPDKDGYLKVVLCVDNKRKTVSIHRIQAIAFIPNPKNKPCVNHIDGVKFNNILSNIEWATFSENSIHAHRNGLLRFQKGVSSHYSKLTEKEVLEIREMKSIRTQEEIAALYNVCRANISHIFSRKTWDHI